MGPRRKGHRKQTNSSDTVSSAAIAKVRAIRRTRANFASLPHLEPFKSSNPVKAYGEFMSWLEQVQEILVFSYGWSEELKRAWFMVNCGPEVRKMVSAYKIRTEDEERPFEGLVEAIEKHIKGLVDPSIQFHSMLNRKQEGMTAAQYFLEL